MALNWLWELPRSLYMFLPPLQSRPFNQLVFVSIAPPPQTSNVCICLVGQDKLTMAKCKWPLTNAGRLLPSRKTRGSWFPRLGLYISLYYVYVALRVSQLSKHSAGCFERGAQAFTWALFNKPSNAHAIVDIVLPGNPARPAAAAYPLLLLLMEM